VSKRKEIQELRFRIYDLERLVLGSNHRASFSTRLKLLEAGPKVRVPVVDSDGLQTMEWSSCGGVHSQGQFVLEFTLVSMEKVIRWLAKENGKQLVMRSNIKDNLDFAEVKKDEKV